MDEISEICVGILKSQIKISGNAHDLLGMYQAFGYLDALSNFGKIDLEVYWDIRLDIEMKYLTNKEWMQEAVDKIGGIANDL